MRLAGYVKNLSRLRLTHAGRFGRKAATLGELCRRGFDIPRGFVIAADAFTKAHRPKPAVEKQVLRAYRRLGAQAVAVRSSSPAEDAPAASSAGQFKTFLNVKGEQSFLSAVRACAASASGAADYLRALASDTATGVAVLVQEMVKADAAGVLFTADPVTGERDSSVVEAVRGLGDALVSGKAAPSRWVVRQDGGFEQSPSAGAPLGRGQVQEMVDTGHRIEKELGCPQDIEWAFAEGRLRILQARPVTALAAVGSKDDVWSNSNVVENLPGILSPMTTSIMQLVEKLTHTLLKGLGFPFPDSMRLLGFRAGRCYLNFGAFYLMADTLPHARREDINLLLGGMQEIPEPERTHVSLARRAAILLRASPMVLGFLQLPFVEKERSRRFIRSYRRLAAADLEKLNSAQLLKEIRKWWDVSFSYGKVSLPLTTRAFFFWRILLRLAERRLGPEGVDLVNRLITGLTGIASTRPVQELWRLSRKALAEPELKDALNSRKPSKAFACFPKGVEFLMELDKVLQEHCYRCDGELDIRAPRLFEDYETVFAVLRSFLATPEHLGPLAVESRQWRVYLDAVGEARGGFGPLRWALIRPLLRQARRALAGRDRTKAVGSMSIAGMRRILLEAGRRFVQAGALKKADEVFYLRIEELFRALEGRLAVEEISAIVLRQKRREEGYRKEAPPDVIVGDINATLPKPRPAPVGNVLKGLGVSAGRVTGRARVVMGKEDFHKLTKGEILVAPWTDPGWTALFLIAGGLVADVGGMLSHGSIVAREIGIPAVTNVKHATSSIKDGQFVTVDGTHGIVELTPQKG